MCESNREERVAFVSPYTKMWWMLKIILLILLGLQQQAHALEPFHPYQQSGSCTSSMSTCAFELRATAAMTMFYKNLFRVIVADNGILQNYQNPNQTFAVTDIMTADGYPKLVCSIHFICLLVLDTLSTYLV